MLPRLLKRISQGGTFSTQSLAWEFNVSSELMEAMLADLVRAGYLRLLDGCDAGACGSCGVAATCKPRGKIWFLVERNLSS